MSPAKNLWGEGFKENFKWRDIKLQDILQQICKNLEGWSKNFQKWQIFPFLAQYFLRGGGVKAKDFFRLGE